MQDNCIPWQDKDFFLLLDNVAQIGIFIFGSSAIWFVSLKKKIKRWGYIFGVCSIPFWTYTTIHHKQYWVLAVSVIYSIGWINGVRNYWVKKDENTK